MTNMDAYWPFDEPTEGVLTRSVNMLRWRKMAHLWCHWGVVSGHRFGSFGVVQRDPGRLLLGGGAAWVNGFYGERYNWSDVATPGDDGMVKVRVDMGAQTMTVFFEAWHAWHSDPHAAHGVFEIPLYEVWPTHYLDRRYFVSNEIVPGLPEIPAWVPKGQTRFEVIPAQVDAGHGGTVMFAFTDWVPGFAEGRTYRVSASFMDATQVAGDAGILRVELRAVRFADQVEIRRRAMCDIFSQINQLRSGFASFLVPSDNTQIFIIANHFIPAFLTVGTPNVLIRFPAFTARMEIADAGLQT
jgi:hypothetical protein